MKKIAKDALILTLITMVAGLALGAVYIITKKPIEEANKAATEKAYKEVFESAASFEDDSSFDADKANSVIAAKGYTDGTVTTCEVTNCAKALDANKQLLGYVVTMKSKAGYGGDIVLSVGITKDGVLNGYSITEISETPGLGMKSTEEAFMKQFKGIKATTLEVSKTPSTDEGVITAISGATITSKAVTYSIDAAILYVSSLLQGGAA